MSVLNLPGLVQKPLGSFDGRKGALIVLLIINPFITMSPYKFSHFRIRIIGHSCLKQTPIITSPGCPFRIDIQSKGFFFHFFCFFSYILTQLFLIIAIKGKTNPISPIISCQSPTFSYRILQSACIRQHIITYDSI